MISISQFIQNIRQFLFKNQIDFQEDAPINVRSYFPIFYLPEKKIILHCIDFQSVIKQNINSSYYADYINQAEQIGFSVLTIWEDYWHKNPEKLWAVLCAKLSQTPYLHGRETYVERISNPELMGFLKAHHLATPIPAKYKFGLRHKSGDLVAVASFSSARKIVRNQQIYRSFELLRFCNQKAIRVHGGFAKLLKEFIKKIQPDDIMTYADREWSSGRVYEQAGFRLVEITPPQNFILDLSDYQRFKVSNIPVHDSERHLLSIFNAGNRKYIKFLK